MEKAELDGFSCFQISLHLNGLPLFHVNPQHIKINTFEINLLWTV